MCIELKIETKIWDKRVTASLFGMYVVDVWLMYTGDTTDTLHPEPELDQQDFCIALSEELIERVRPTKSRGGVNHAQIYIYINISGAR